jgi:hypothetical protein
MRLAVTRRSYSGTFLFVSGVREWVERAADKFFVSEAGGPSVLSAGVATIVGGLAASSFRK